MTENLLPRDIYSDKGIRRTIPVSVFAGLMFGGLFFFVFGGLTLALFGFVGAVDEGWSVLPVMGVICALGGVGFGLVTAFMIGLVLPRQWAAVVDKIYYRDPEMAPSPENEGDFRYRFPAGYLRSPHINVGGILYLGRSGLMFHPHKKNLPSHRISIYLTPLESIKMEVVPHKVNPFFRLFVKSVPPMFTIVSASCTGNFLIPKPTESIGHIETAIKELLDQPNIDPQ